MKTLAKILLLGIFFLTVLIIGFICPIGLIIVGIIKWSFCIIMGGLFWLATSLMLYFTVGDDLEEQFKEELEK